MTVAGRRFLAAARQQVPLFSWGRTLTPKALLLSAFLLQTLALILPAAILPAQLRTSELALICAHESGRSFAHKVVYNDRVL
ncbi:hypothetical protein [Cryobacterium sp. PH31-O1]|uniref:hypothetical protein n=1 Tax=Cryobacterium sp. PH31-O1 TaxID=3046306 RepID=UPI0024BBCF66|nr:hypothetical protein [Cryobacterium sp. PH31-O1]MDJ0338691.1 hypothetical protein [Cryobacterium sp. PH31-O1]